MKQPTKEFKEYSVDVYNYDTVVDNAEAEFGIDILVAMRRG